MEQHSIHSGVTETLDIAETFAGSVERRGRFQMTLSGVFAPPLQQVVTWHTSVLKNLKQFWPV